MPTDPRVNAIRDASGHQEREAELILRGLHRHGWDVVRLHDATPTMGQNVTVDEVTALQQQNARMRAAIADVSTHVAAWTGLLESHVASLPPDTRPNPNCDSHADRSYAEHELGAMQRDLAALVASAA